MKNKEEKKNRIWVPIVIGVLACSAAVGTGVALVHNQQRPKASTVATMSDAADFSGLTTEVTITTEEATTEAAIEASVNESTKPEAVPATTEIGGGKKKAEETTEEQKPSTSSNSGSGHSSTSGNSSNNSTNNGSSNSSGNNSSGSSNSGNSGSNNSANSGSNNGGNSNSANNNNAANNTPQHQHNYNVWVKTKDAWDETVIDTPEQTIEHPEEGYWADAVRCNTCYGLFTSMDEFFAHKTRNGGWCNSSGSGSSQKWVKTKDAWTETIPAKTHTVHHDEEGYWTCSCGARK